MRSEASREQTIVVRLWWEPHDTEVRARLLVVPLDLETFARGQADIEQAFMRLLDEVLSTAA